MKPLIIDFWPAIQTTIEYIFSYTVVIAAIVAFVLLKLPFVKVLLPPSWVKQECLSWAQRCRR